MTDAIWISGLVLLPTVVVLVSYLRLDVERLRTLAVFASVGTLGVASFIALSPGLGSWSIHMDALSSSPGGDAVIRLNRLSAALLPFASALWLLTVAVTPRASLDRGGLRRAALATLVTLASFLTESPIVLLVLSVASVWTFLSAVGPHRAQRGDR